MTLSDVRRAAVELAIEIEKAQSLGTVPPTHDELHEFCEEVEAADNDDCERCTEVEEAYRAFGQCVDGDATAVECGEALAQLLAAIKPYGYALADGRAVVNDFVRKATAYETAEQAKGAA